MVVYNFFNSPQWPWRAEFDMPFETCKDVFVIVVIAVHITIIVILGITFCTLNFSIYPIPDKLHSQMVVVDTEDLSVASENRAE